MTSPLWRTDASNEWANARAAVALAKLTARAQRMSITQEVLPADVPDWLESVGSLPRQEPRPHCYREAIIFCFALLGMWWVLVKGAVLVWKLFRGMLL